MPPPGPTELADKVALFQSDPAAWLATSSYGNVTLQPDFTITWHRMPNPQGFYANYKVDWEKHQQLMQHAVSAADAEVYFPGYELLYVVTPDSASAIPISPAFIASPGWGVWADGWELRHGATFGQDVDGWGYKILNHETGHVFGLPDLYAYGYLAGHPLLHDAAGGWDLMSLTSGPAPDHFAWHKWKLGWLDDSQIACVTSPGQLTDPVSVSPLGSTAGGYKAVVVKTDTHRAVVVENRQVSALDEAGPCFQPGLLAYVVDSSTGGGGVAGNYQPTGVMPITVLDRTPESEPGSCDPEEHRLVEADLVDATLTAHNHDVTDDVSDVTVRRLDGVGGDIAVEIDW